MSEHPSKSSNLKVVASSVASAISGALTFQKSLSDLVKGIRNSKNNEAAFISQCIQEIKEELKNPDNKVRMIAIQKLTYVCWNMVPLFLGLWYLHSLVTNEWS